MSLDNIKLNPLAVTELYRKSIVAIPDNPQATPMTEPAAPDLGQEPVHWRYLGGAKKNILLAVRYPNEPFLPDQHLSFLTSMLGACKLALSDVAILNLQHAPSHIYKDVQMKFRPTVAILFGVSPREFEMPLDFPEFQVQSFNHCTFLYTPALDRLETDQLFKSKLWVSLRRIFNLS